MHFALAERLGGDIKRIAEEKGITDGIVIIKTKTYNSPPYFRFDVIPMKSSPTDYLRELAKEEGVDKALLETLGTI